MHVRVERAHQTPGHLQKEKEAFKHDIEQKINLLKQKLLVFKTQAPQAGLEDILFEATVTKRDIDAYNRGKIDEQTFQNRIAFRKHEPQLSRDKKIDIMADILSSGLKRDTDIRILGHTKSAGFYQKGVGALFLVSHKADPFTHENETDALKTAVIETLADYGSTLRELSAEESIIVHANLIGNFKIVRIVRTQKDKTPEVIKPPDRLLFRVAKRHIDAYASKKISLDTFRKKVEITEM